MLDRSGFRGWWIAGVAFATQAIAIGCTIGTYSLFIRPVVDEFGASYAQANLGLAIMTVFMTLAGPVVGPLLDRTSIRNIMIAGALVNAVSLALMSVATELWQLLVLVGFGLAVGVAMLGPLASVTVVAKWFDTKRGRALGVANMGAPAGPLIVAPLAGTLVETIGWRPTLLGFAGLTLLSIPVIAGVIVNRPEDIGQRPDGAPEAGTREPADHGPEAEGWSTARLLRDRNFWALALGVGIVFGIGGGWNAQIVPFAADLGIETQQASLVLGLAGGVAILGTILFGSLSDRFDQRSLMWIVIGIQILAFAVLRTQPPPPLFVVAMMVFGLSGGGLLPLYAAVIGRVFGPASFGQVMGTAGLVMLPFGFAAPLVAGWLRDQSGSYESTIAAFIVSFVLAGAALSLLRAKPQPA